MTSLQPAAIIYDNTAERPSRWRWFRYYWSDDSVDKLAHHGLTVDDFEFAFENYHRQVRSNSSARLIRFGRTFDGRAIAAVFQWDEPNVTVIPITAYEVREP